VSHGSKHKRLRRQLVHRGMPCAECGRPVTTHDAKLDTHAELDHIVPVALGGKDERSNYQVLCRRCNRRKGKKMPLREPVTSQEW
jgi:5-methylcytosine-specific restriction endonuclease McrA